MYIKKAFHISCILIYLVFSQFVIKALITTEHANSGADAFCINKSLNTLDSKQNCREAKNIASFGELFDPSKYLIYAQSAFISTEAVETFFVDTIPTIWFHAHAPPRDVVGNNIQSYVQRYVGIVLLLI